MQNNAVYTEELKPLGFIPARGGSKRIPRKNIVDFGGEPLIAHTIRAALGSDVFDEVVVSTDDPEIADLSINYGASVPYLRPAELATDFASSADAAVHLLDYFRGNGKNYTRLCSLLPNCPLRDSRDIRESYEMFQSNNVWSVHSLTDFGGAVPFWAIELDDQQRIKFYWGEKYFSMRSQDMPVVYVPTGALRWVKAEALREKRSFYGEGALGFILPRKRAVDIDDEEDLLFARALLKVLQDEKDF